MSCSKRETQFSPITNNVPACRAWSIGAYRGSTVNVRPAPTSLKIYPRFQ